jgi:hypothetical protein
MRNWKNAKTLEKGKWEPGNEPSRKGNVMWSVAQYFAFNFWNV